MTDSPKNSTIRKRIIVIGVVQGVGFRPFIYKLAGTNLISGFVRNTSAGVVIEAEGEKTKVESFIRDISVLHPPKARVDSVESVDLPVAGSSGFSIEKSEGPGEVTSIVPPDMAMCPDCRNDILDPSNRRYLYPFTNCTNC